MMQTLYGLEQLLIIVEHQMGMSHVPGMVSTVQTKELKQREVKQLARGHTAGKNLEASISSRLLNSNNLDSQVGF